MRLNSAVDFSLTAAVIAAKDQQFAGDRVGNHLVRVSRSNYVGAGGDTLRALNDTDRPRSGRAGDPGPQLCRIVPRPQIIEN